MLAPEKEQYQESFYSIRFLELLTENIKRKHQTLSYILRTQYKDSDVVYKALLEGKSCLDSFTLEYYEQVTNFIIDPVLQYHDFTSPTIRLLTFLSLLNQMRCDYLGRQYKEEERVYMRRISREIDIEFIDELVNGCKSACNPIEYERCVEEIQVWREQKARHFNRRSR